MIVQESRRNAIKRMLQNMGKEQGKKNIQKLPSKEQVMKLRFGHASFRPGQEEIVDTILRGKDCLAVLPTGGGKSLCFQIPALMQPGVTFVVSPLISLMEDQVAHLRKAGIPAACLNSSMSRGTYNRTLYEAGEGSYKLLYLSPERLWEPYFLRFALCCPPDFLVVDEAHCVSQWGNDFRPSYIRIRNFMERLPRRPLFAAFTATATPRVREDIIGALGLREPAVIVRGFDRPNLYFAKAAPVNKDRALLNVLEKKRGQSGIIYCATHAAVERVTRLLRQRGEDAARYHGGLTPGEREQVRAAFVAGRLRIVVATSAFGMGLDRSDVSFIIHYQMPQSLEEYFQEAGRAGRNGEEADCLLFYSREDLCIQEALLQKTANCRTGRVLLQNMWEYCQADGCLRRFILRYFGEERGRDCGHCSNCTATSPFTKILHKIWPGRQEKTGKSRIYKKISE